MKVLVLGGTRFLGRHLVQALLARNHEVTLFLRRSSRSAVIARAVRRPWPAWPGGTGTR